MKNNAGRFVAGHTETAEIKKKRILSMQASWKSRPDYLGDIKHSPLHNIWRSFMFTQKGKKAGHSEEWGEFKKFFSDMSETYQNGLRLGRIDKSKPFSKENCLWMTNEELANTRECVTLFTYNGETKTLRDWAITVGATYSAIRQRFFR